MSSAWFHNHFDRGARLAADDHAGKGRYADQINPERRQIAARDGDRFECLVGGTGPDRLNLDRALFPDDARNGAGDRVGDTFSISILVTLLVSSLGSR